MNDVSKIKKIWAIGVSGSSSMNGVKVALLETDGVDIFSAPVAIVRHYDDDLKQSLLSLSDEDAKSDKQNFDMVNKRFTSFCEKVILELLEKAQKKIEDIDVIGFYGQNLYNQISPENTLQLGDSQYLANSLGVKVVSGFRVVDVRAGGYGSPLEPAYLSVLSLNLEKPLAVLKIGDLTTVTIIGLNGEVQAFVVGAGNRIIDDWMRKKCALEMDFDGLEASKGNLDSKMIDTFLDDVFFQKNPPKNVPKDYFSKYILRQIEGMSIQDGAANLTYFVAAGIKKSMDNFAIILPCQYVVCGGGVLNPTLMRFISRMLGEDNVKRADEVGWDGVTLEAQSYAFLAVRSLYNMAISYPETTGVSEPLSGGSLYCPAINNGMDS